MNILIFIIILAILVLAHEFGHFIVAKKSGIRVDEFGLGFPPKLYGKKFGETLYTINAIPFGGFVKIFGENPDEESMNGDEKKRSFINQPRPIQVAVLSAGVIFNLLTAWILISVSLMMGSAFSASSPIPNGTWIEEPVLTILEVVKGSPADNAGIITGDRVLSLSDEKGATPIFKPTPEVLQNYIASHENQKVTLSIERGGKEIILGAMPTIAKGSDKPAIGVAMDTVGKMRLSFFSAIKEGGNLTLLYTSETFKGIFGLIGDSFHGRADMSQVSGPVGIVKIVGDTTKLGFERLLVLTAIISINLAVVNVLPIPALDGGRVFFVLIESIIRKPIKPKFANTVNSIGFIVLMGLILIITFHDVWKLISG